MVPSFTLVTLASIDRKECLETFVHRCVEDPLSVAKLRKHLVEEYDYRPSAEVVRVKQLAATFLRGLSVATSAADKILGKDKGATYINAVPSVKSHAREKTIEELDEALDLLKSDEKRNKILTKCLRKARDDLEKLQDVP